jgi:HD-GYP domain-containing protein (c-di-GMP phosphodiesterase class II)
VKPLLILATGRTLSPSPAPLGRREEDIEVRRTPALPTPVSLDPDRPTVLVLDRALLQSGAGDSRRLEELARAAVLVGLGEAHEPEPPADFPLDLLTGYLPSNAPVGAIMAMLRGAFRHAAAQVSERHARAAEEQRRRELTELTNVGVALSTERDLTTLLQTILTQARRLTDSDAGSVYLVERDASAGTTGARASLRFKLSQNDTLPALPFSEFTVPVDHTSLAGYAAATGDPLLIGDVYRLPSDVTYRQNRSFDEKFGYHTRSMLVIPMKSHRDEMVGVVQLINRKRNAGARLTSLDMVDREVVPYDDRCLELVSALASQAAVAIENSWLYEDIERLFEGFVTAAVTAIESRDPTTSGQSSRVATLTVGLAEVVDRVSDGPYRDVRFTREQLRELRYAGLLHDFGKVGVREQVLVKQKKLYGHELEIIRHRVAQRMRDVDLAFERERAALLLTDQDQYERCLPDLAASRDRSREHLRASFAAIVAANEPTVVPEGAFEHLRDAQGLTYVDFDGAERPLLEDHELAFLMIRRGNLDERERREIESHVTHTFRFLEHIPWTRELRDVPRIAFGHHEKLNGRGYPRGVAGDAIPVQTRMMTISDIFDALTAADRPYKRAVPLERALDILHMEANEGMLDQHLLDAFVQARVFDRLASGAAESRA